MEILSGAVTLPHSGACEGLYEAIHRASSSSSSSLSSSPAVPISRVSTSNQHHPNSSSSFNYASNDHHHSAHIKNQSKHESTTTTHQPCHDNQRAHDPRLQRYKSEKELYGAFAVAKEQRERRGLDVPEPVSSGRETQEVFTQVMDIVSANAQTDDVQTFKDNCRLYGQDQLSLEAYYQYLSSLGGPAFLAKLMPPLVRLLPTAQKRHALWSMYSTSVVV